MIRQITVNDISQTANLLASVWQSAYQPVIDDSFLRTRTQDNFEKILKKVIQENLETIYVYEDGKIIRGIVSGNKLRGEKYDCEIIRLYIDLNHQNKGIGTKLLKYMQEYYKTNNCKTMIIWAVKGLRNNNFYKKNGGVDAEETVKKFGDKEYPIIGYVYNLS